MRASLSSCWQETYSVHVTETPSPPPPSVECLISFSPRPQYWIWLFGNFRGKAQTLWKIPYIWTESMRNVKNTSNIWLSGGSADWAHQTSLHWWRVRHFQGKRKHPTNALSTHCNVSTGHALMTCEFSKSSQDMFWYQLIYKHVSLWKSFGRTPSYTSSSCSEHTTMVVNYLLLLWIWTHNHSSQNTCWGETLTHNHLDTALSHRYS